MGFDLFGWFSKKMAGPETRAKPGSITEEERLIGSLYIRELAFWSIVNRIAGAVSKCEFRTYKDGKEVRDREYYLWNFEPNSNENANTFIMKLLGQLYRNNEALVVDFSGQLLVADSYQRTSYALYPDVFHGVTVGDMTFERTFSASEVLYFQLNSEDMHKLISGMYGEYSKLLEYAMKAYQKSRGHKGILKIDAQAQADDAFDERLSDLLNTQFKGFFRGDNAVLPLYDGYSYEDLGSKTYSTESTRDIKALSDDIYEYTARAFGFPPALALGNVQDTSKAVDELLTFCIDPLVDLLETEINRKRNGFDGFKRGDRLRIDTTHIRHIDLVDVSGSIDKLISSGCYTINDIRRLTGDDPIYEDWADRHFLTKNYSDITAAAEPLGGDTDD